MSLIGTIVSHYEIVEKLGGGGMGVIYRAEDTKLKRQVALKFLPSELVADDEVNKRFVLEAQTASSLNHPNICTIHEIGETEDGRVFIAMALYEGKTLKALLQEADSELDWKVAVDIARQIADGLAAAHDKGIIHRDVKPANVLVTDTGRAVLLDFGIAKLSGTITLTRTGSTLGTIAYMSPEQAQAGEVDHRADIWALGTLLYEMLAAQRPFEGDYDQAIAYNIVNSPHRSLRDVRPGLPDALYLIVDKALEKDREKRYATAQNLASDLKGLGAGEPVVIQTTRSIPTKVAARVGLGVALIVLITIVYRFLPMGGRDASFESIAVLPLVNLSGDAEQDYFVDGMTDALITELSKIRALRVISRRSVIRYKDSDKPLSEIAGELGVDALVEGTVIRSGEVVRVSAQLVSAKSQENVWAQSFDREVQNILALYTEVARSVADELRVSLTAAEEKELASAAEVDPAAYEAYLKGQFYWYRLSPETFDAALEQFHRALEIDSNFAPAYTGIARVWGAAGLWGGVEPRVAVAKVHEAVDKALALDDQLSEAYFNRAAAKFIYEWDYAGSEEAFRRAIELHPANPDWHALYADLLNSMLRKDEAIAEARKGVELDPLSSFAHAVLGWVLLCARDYEASMKAHNEALRIDPMMPLALRGHWWLNYHLGDSSAAVNDAATFYETQGLDPAAEVLRREYPHVSYGRAMKHAADALGQVADTAFVPSMRIARLYVHAGEWEKALGLLERAVEERFPSVVAMNVDPQWDDIRHDPRFVAILTRLKLPVRKSDPISDAG